MISVGELSQWNKIIFRELKGQRDFNTQYISTFSARLLIFRVSRLPIHFSLFSLSLPRSKSERRVFLFPFVFSFSYSLSFFFSRWASIFGAVKVLRFKMYAKDRSTPRILTRYTPRRKVTPSFRRSLEYFSRD